MARWIHAMTMLMPAIFFFGCVAAQGGDKKIAQDGGAGVRQAMQQDGGVNIVYAAAGSGTLALLLWLTATFFSRRIDAEQDANELRTHERIVRMLVEGRHVDHNSNSAHQ